MNALQTQEQAKLARRKRVEKSVSETVHRLSVKQRTAVIEYLCGESKTRACEIAGYAHPNSQASRIFQNKSIQAVIDEFFHRKEMTAQSWVQRMSEQAQAIYAEYFYWDEEKEVVAIDVRSLLADGYSYLIKDVNYKDAAGGTQVIEFQPAFDSQMAIARYLGLFTDKQEISGPAGGPIQFIEVMAPPGEGD